MRKKKQEYNSDWMSRKMDGQLEQLEDNLTALYANASYDVNQEFSKFTDTFKKQDAAKRQELESGNITDAEYSLWRQKQILHTDMYKATVDKITDTLVKADKAAMAVVNGTLPSVVAQSYNFTQALGWESAQKAGLSVGTFQIYNANSVQSILKGSKIMKDVDLPEDEKWNRDKINKTITTSIIKGDSIEKTADSLQGVTNMDRNAAIRNARTCMTAAENLGRTESAQELRDKGIPVVEVWSAVHDARTRETHILLDGTTRDENTGLFGEGILLNPLEYPADPDGDPEEIYNCRCRLSIQIRGIDHSNDDALYEQFMKENDPESWEAIKDKDADKEAAFQARREAAENKYRDMNPQESKENPKDFITEKNADVPNGMQARAAEVQDMSHNEIRDEFIDNPSSYIYDPKYQAMIEERKNLLNESDALHEERKSLEEELKGESHVKPKSEWTEDEKLYFEIIGDKPMEYTERGEEIEDKLKDVRDRMYDIEPKISKLNEDLQREDRFNFIKEESEWEKEIDRWSFEEGNKDKDYDGFSTKMGLSFDKDLEAGKGFIAEMSPDEYLDRIAFEIFHTTRERAIVCDYSNVKEYAKMMANGTKFDMGYLDYTDGGQEGRHRAMAAKLLGIEKIPVYIRGRSR